MTSAAITLLALLLIKHCLCDFVLQTPWQLAQKGTYGAPGGLVHSGIHVAGTLRRAAGGDADACRSS